jgi:hypothetical protein
MKEHTRTKVDELLLKMSKEAKLFKPHNEHPSDVGFV